MQVIDELLKRGADINARRPDGARPLDLTFGDYDYRSWYRDLPFIGLRKHEVVIGYLLGRGAYYDISVAAKIGDYQRIKQLLDEDPALINRQPEHIGYYSGLPLRAAAGGGHKVVVELLLDRGADINGPEPRIAPWGGALHAALSSRQYEIAKLLIEKGADVNAAVESSGNVLSMAQWQSAPPEIIDLLKAHGAKLSDELIGYDGDVATLTKELEENPDKDITWILDYAISNEFQPMLDFIMHRYPNALKERTTDSRAWWDNNVPKNAAFVRRMLEYGLDPNRRNWLGITMLHRCANQGNKEIAEVLLEFGADINAIETEWYSTPLGWAAREGRKEIVAFLLEKGADPNTPFDEPWAKPIEWAKRKQHQDIIALLQPFA
jgi:ankyrin repeat protein